MKEQTTLTTDHRDSGVKVVCFHGDLDSLGVRMVEDTFRSAVVERTARLVVDLGDVGFISSAGLAMLLIMGKMLRQGGGKLTIASAGKNILEVLSLAGFDELFEIYPTLPEAVAIMERPKTS
jgi:anti-anti-sigma factor